MAGHMVARTRRYHAYPLSGFRADTGLTDTQPAAPLMDEPARAAPQGRDGREPTKQTC